MVKAVGPLADGTMLVILGLSSENLSRLQQKHPIDVDLRTLVPPRQQVTRICLCWGETEADITAELAALMKAPS